MATWRILLTLALVSFNSILLFLSLPGVLASMGIESLPIKIYSPFVISFIAFFIISIRGNTWNKCLFLNSGWLAITAWLGTTAGVLIYFRQIKAAHHGSAVNFAGGFVLIMMPLVYAIALSIAAIFFKKREPA
jgi:hypothetical protein